MDNDKVLPKSKDAIKNNETKQTQIFVLPPELLKGLLLQNKIPQVNDSKNFDAVNKPKNVEKVEKRAEHSSDNLAITIDKTNKIERKDDAAITESVQDSSANTDEQKKKETPVNKKTNQNSTKKTEELSMVTDITKQTIDVVKTTLIKDIITPVKETSASKSIAKILNQREVLKIADKKQNVVNQNCNEENAMSNNLLEESIAGISHKVELNVNDLSVIRPTNKENSLNSKFAKEQMNTDKIEKSNVDTPDKSKSLINKNQPRYPWRKRNSQTLNKILNISTDAQGIESQEKDNYANNLSEVCNEPGEVIFSPVQNNETIITNIITEKEQINIDTTCTKSERPSLDVEDEITKSMNINQIRYSKRKRNSKIAELKNISNALNGKTNIEIQSQNKDNHSQTLELPQKSFSKTIIEKYTTQSTENVVDVNSTLKPNSKKISTSESCVGIENLNLNTLNECSKSVNENQTRYPRRRLSKLSSSTKNDKIINNIENVVTSTSSTKIEKQSEHFNIILKKNVANQDESNNTFDESKKVSNSEIQDESTNSADISPLRYSRRKRITKVLKSSETIISSEIKQSVSNTNENEETITINDLTNENSIDTKIIKKTPMENMICLDTNESSKINNNIIQSNQVVASDTNIQRPFENEDDEIEIIEEIEYIIEQVLEEKSTEVSDNIIVQNTIDSDSCKIQNASNKHAVALSCVNNLKTIPNDSIDSEENKEASNNIIAHSTIDFVNCQIQSSPNKQTCENIEVTVPNDTIDSKEYTEDFNNIIVYDTVDSDGYEIENSTNKHTVVASFCKNNQQTVPNDLINCQLIDNEAVVLEKTESPNKNTFLRLSCENNQETNINNSVNLKLNDSNDIVLNKEENEKVNVYINKKKIRNDTYSKESNNKTEECSKETDEKSAPVTVSDIYDTSNHDAQLPILTVRRSSVKSCRRKSVLDSSTFQQERKEEPKGRNRRKWTNQINDNKFDVMNTRSRSASLSINSNLMKKGKSEDIKISNIKITKNSRKKRKGSCKLEQKIEENCIANETEINLNYVNDNDKQDVTIDIKEILDSLAMDDNQDETDSLLISDRKTDFSEKSVISQYNFNDSTNNVLRENIQLIECNESQNGEKGPSSEDKVNIIKNYPCQYEEKNINFDLKKEKLLVEETVEDKKKDKILTEINKPKSKNSSIQNVKRTDSDGMLERYDCKLLVHSESTEKTLESPENPKHLNLEFTKNLRKCVDNNEIFNASIHNGQNRLNNLNASKIPETNCLSKSNEDIQSETHSKIITKTNLNTSKESDTDSIDDNYESMNISFKNDDDISISSIDDLSKNIKEEIFPAENLRNLEKIDDSQNKVQDDKFMKQQKIEESPKSIIDVDGLKGIINNNNDQIEQSELAHYISNINKKNFNENDSNSVELISSSKVKSFRPIEVVLNTNSQSIKNIVNISLSREIDNSSHQKEHDTVIDQSESIVQDNGENLEVFENNDNFDKVSEKIITFTGEVKNEHDGTKNKNDDNFSQINVTTEDRTEATKTNDSVFESNNSIDNIKSTSDANVIIHKVNDKIICDKFVDKDEYENNSILEFNNPIDNLKTGQNITIESLSTEGKENVSEELRSDMKSRMDISQIEDNKNKAVPITSPTITLKKRRGRPPKSAEKINIKKSEKNSNDYLTETVIEDICIDGCVQQEVKNDIKINNRRRAKQELNLSDKPTKNEQKDCRTTIKKRRNVRLSFTKEPRRSTRHKIDKSSEECLNSSNNQKIQNRRSSNRVKESQTTEKNTATNVHTDKNKDIKNKLLCKNVDTQGEILVKKRRGRPPKLKLEETNTFKDLEGDTSVKRIDDDVLNEIFNEDKNCDTIKEINNHSTAPNENNAVDIVSINTRKRKRSTRKISIQKDDELESENDSMRTLNTTIVEQENDQNDSSASDADENITQTVKKRKGSLGLYKKRRRGKKRGRPPGAGKKLVYDNDYVPHHSHLKRTSKKGTFRTDSCAELSAKKVVTCGKCDVEITKSQWSHHNLMTHNDTGWLKGSAKPDFENDEKLLKRVINIAHKKRKKTLVCEQCKIIKRSVAGYFSHLTFCGKSEEEMEALMVRCPVCHAVTKPSSVEYHERIHRMEAEVKERMPEIDIETIDLEGPRGKRKAAERAVNKISEFTAMAKEDKENFGPIQKKFKISYSMKRIIQRPQMEKRIPSVSINKWRKDLANGQNATCSQSGCQFTSNSFDEMKSHYSTCNFTPRENYICKICRFQSSTEKEIVQHALEKHPLDDDDANLSLSEAESSSSDNLSDNENKNKTQPQAVMKKFFYKESAELTKQLFKFIFKNGSCHTKFSKIYFKGLQWTLEFERKNYKFNLFEEFAPNNFIFLNSKESYPYVPELEKSMPMMIIKNSKNNETQSEWKTWKRFEGKYCGDNPTFFVGGPVWALAWLPIPTSLSLSEDLSQFIAVSTHPTMDATYSVGESYSGKNIIQIWNAGRLNHKSGSEYNPKLAYAIIHEGGTVWSLEWCPSGCYQHKDLPGYKESNRPNKMGLLAAGCSDGCVRIYSLAFPQDFTNENIENNDKYPIYSTEPVLILIINKTVYDNKQQNWQVTKLSWSKERNHNIIAAGFSNGYIALWNLASTSSLLKYKKGNTVYLNAYKNFFAHHHAITMVHLIPHENRRFIATASLDRLYKFWDLEDISNPKNVFKKSYVTDGAWLNHWYTAFVSFDDALSMGHNYSYCLPLRDYTYKYFNIFPTNSPSFSISTSDYGNSIANGTLAGEILAMFPHQMIYIRDMEKTLPRKRFFSLISTTELVDFQKLPENTNLSNKKNEKKSSNNKSDKSDDNTPYDFMPSTYEDSKDRFGIKFHDKLNSFREQCMIKPKNQKKTLTIEMMEKVAVEQYPFRSVNKLSWNPNASSFLWLAAGYQNGFVRLMSFKSMASPAEWSKLLTEHLETLKSDCSESQSTRLDDR